MTDYFAIDTNILVYAFNTGSPFHQKAGEFLSQKMTEFNEFGRLPICVCQQTCIEFTNSITWQKLEKPLTIKQAVEVLDYLEDCGLTIINPKQTQLTTYKELLLQSPSRKRVFDISITATLKDNNIKGIYTVNTKDFQDYSFLKVINPLL